VSLDRLQRLEACEAQADLQQRHIELLQKQIAETDAALKLELARGEKHAEALMHVARTCDERTSELKEQHAAALRVKDAVMTKMEMSHAAAISKLEAHHKDVVADLKAENAALRAQAASTLTEILAAVAAVTTGAMEILPVRPDSRQFVEWRVGGIPPPAPPQFDRAWCAAVCDWWGVQIDAAAGDTRAIVRSSSSGYCTLRSDAPLPRGPDVSSARQRLPAYRVVIEALGEDGRCCLGFVPSHNIHGSGPPTAVVCARKCDIDRYGGWCIEVRGWSTGTVDSGWTAMTPAESAYATTHKVPEVIAGGAVEFAVDYVTGTCRVAFYTPAAVAGGFVEPSHAKMELRFVASTEDRDIYGMPYPRRPVPTAADSVVALYPAVQTRDRGSVWRFVAV
jgi:hypothetical protein